jgi:hypothetical protein
MHQNTGTVGLLKNPCTEMSAQRKYLFQLDLGHQVIDDFRCSYTVITYLLSLLGITPYLKGISELLRKDVLKILAAFKPLLVEEGYDGDLVDELVAVRAFVAS